MENNIIENYNDCPENNTREYTREYTRILDNFTNKIK